MNYSELKEKQREEMNSFEGIFFAFSDSQFTEGLASLGITRDEAAEKLARIVGGGFILKSRVKAFKEMLYRFDAEVQQLKSDRAALLDALIYELNNHEYCITGDPQPALDSLGYTRKDIPNDIYRKALKATQY